VVAAAEDADEATVYLYDEISWFWGITADDFAREVAALDVGRINLRINSPGGDVFDGVAIYNLLRSHRAEVHVIVDGLAASIASVIAMAGDTITMGAGTQMMVHDPHGVAIGGAEDMRSFADLLDKTAGEIAGFYTRKAGGTVAEWQAVMDAETWYTGPEAVAAGLADAAEGTATDEAVADYRRFDLRARGFRYSGRGASPVPSTVDRSAALRARHHARTTGGKP
jgi:ATP-dependent protease ClpP protease subunit